jgi:transcriptional regulator with XRE-family HTH domain
METPLRAARKALELTLDQVAKEVGTDMSNLAKVERGVQGATPQLAEKLSEFFRSRGHVIAELEILYPERYVRAARSSEPCSP